MDSSTENQKLEFNVRNTGDNDDDDVPLKVLPLSQVYEKLDAKLKRCKISDCGGSTSREETLSELFRKELVKKRISKQPINKRCKRAREDDDDNITIAEINKSRKLGKRSRHEEEKNDSGLVQKPAFEEETVAPQEIEPHIGVNAEEEEEEEETGTEEEKVTVVIASDENNSSDTPLAASNGGIAVLPQETRQNGDVNGSNTEEKTERLLRMEEIALKLKARMMNVEKTLTKIIDWKTRGNKIKQEVSA